MSGLARTALRLAVVSALGADPTIAAMCGDRIFDSRIDDLDSTEMVPVIIVLTEDENGDEFSRNDGGPPFLSTVDLVLEISMRAMVEVPTTDGSPPAIDMATPYTDRELEASLDLLEERAVYAITIADTPQSLLVRQAVTRRVRKVRSFRYVLPDTGVKLATRMLTLSTELKNPSPDDPTNLPTGPFAALPDPLRTVCEGMASDSGGLATCTALAAKITPPSAPVLFTEMDLTYAPQPLSPDSVPNPQVDTYSQDIEIND